MLRYAITDGRLQVGADETAREKLAAECAALSRGGIGFILIREKALAAGELVALSRQVVTEVRRAGAKTQVLIAGRPDVALVAGADGVHLASGPGELCVAEIRQVFPNAFVSVSCHTVDEVRAAQNDGASAVLFAPVFGKSVEGAAVVAPAGLQALQEACAVAGQMPVFALGGVTEANAEECVGMGVAGVAGIRMFFAPQRRVNTARAGV